ncbi:MAG TPA: pyridoxal-dependent decarboxylase [Gemmatimonadota bacterium]|nr:pyridoxal-dependent decarboxylase [Gemmatimonadota bacterium]
MSDSDPSIETIRRLERAAAPLEPGPSERRALREAVVEHAEAFLEGLTTAPAYVADKEAAAEVGRRAFGEGPTEIGEILDLFRRGVEETGLKPSSGGHLAYIPGGGLYASALGDYLADVTNEYAGIRFTGPGAVEMENALLAWMAGLVGYPEDAAGNLASGGSIANLIAVVTAREAHGLRALDVPRAVVYLTDQAHHCLEKALRIGGLGECGLRRVSMDARGRMDPAALEAAVAEDEAAGLRPWLLLASAGTTDVGAVDPLEALGRVARERGLWYHVDAAYGGFFALCPEVRDRLAGIELSDSVVMDPHKSLFLPYGLGAVLVKDREAMVRAHHYRADYLQDAAAEETPLPDSPAELSPELTKHFRGLRLWLPLLLHGVAPFRACLEEKLALARWFHRRVGELGFETGPEPELTVVTYRWVPEEGDPDAFNEALVRAIHEDGRIFVSSTRVDGNFVLRLAVLTFRTHLEHVERTLEVLEEKVRELEGR